jgi:hypothetical protein
MIFECFSRVFLLYLWYQMREEKAIQRWNFLSTKTLIYTNKSLATTLKNKLYKEVTITSFFVFHQIINS